VEKVLSSPMKHTAIKVFLIEIVLIIKKVLKDCLMSQLPVCDAVCLIE
jgi:hypothetical protein